MFEHYQKLWGLNGYSKSLETHSSFLYWCVYRNQKVVLKIYKPHSDEAVSAKFLLHYAGHGAVGVLQHCDKAVLLEQVHQGKELVELAKISDYKATKVFCELIQKLRLATPDNLGFKPVIELVIGFDGFKTRKPNDQYLVKEAKTLFIMMAESQSNLVNLHGDLHHYNIIQAQDGNWLIIDPKGYWGELEYEMGAFLRNPLNQNLTIENLQQRLQIIHETLGLDMARVKNWAFCQAVLAAIWGKDTPLYDHFLFIAKQFEVLL